MKGSWYGSRERCRRCGKRLVMEEWEVVGEAWMKWKCRCGMVYIRKWWSMDFDKERWFKERFGKKWKGYDELVEELEKLELDDERRIEFECERLVDEMGWGMNSWLNCSLDVIMEELVNVVMNEWEEEEGKISRRKVRRILRGMKEYVRKNYGMW